MREFFTIAIFKIKADIRMNKTTLNSQKEKHSMLSLRRATFVGLAAHRLRNISIHALLAESDADNGDAGNGCDAISIHALLAESDYWLPVRHSRTEAFLSTLSLRSATAAEHRLLALNSISIHALLAESDLIHITQYSMCKISIHALLAESDPLSTALRPAANISIHALLAESDERPQHNQYTHIAISIHALLAESDFDTLAASG